MSKTKFYTLASLLVASIVALAFAFIMPEKVVPYLTSDADEIKIQPNKCLKEKGEVNITLITDSRYVMPTAVSISSAIKNKCPSSIYNFYVIAENITSKESEFLQQLKMLAEDTVNIQIIPRLEPDLPYDNMKRFIHYKVAMHKLYLPEILKNLNKVIYMDGDTLVLKDLRELFNTNITNVYAAVAKDGIFYRYPKEMVEMGLDKRGFYFNSGVMLYNLSLQRRDRITDKAIEYVKIHEDFFGDQDVLNIVFEDKLKLMSYRYNCISNFFETDDLNFLSQYFGEPLPKKTFHIYENATILHYAGKKPWQSNFEPLYLKELWYRYYNEIRGY